MDREEVTKWLTIMKANLNSFPVVSNAKKIEALEEAIRFLKNEDPSGSEIPNKSENPTSSTTKNDLGVDCISRKAVQTRLKEIINEMETIFTDIREREVNDSVCGLCEYDCDHGLDGFANECPGFEKDDCFKLNEKYRAEWLDISNLPSVTPIRPKAHWIDHSDEGYVECPKCGSATNCDSNINDLHFCFSCGAEMGVKE